jgi:type IV pilus assembly protein PilB
MNRDLEPIARPGGLSRAAVDALAASARQRNVALWHVLTVEERWPEEAVADALSLTLGVPRVRLEGLRIQPDALKIIAPRVARQHICLPIRVTAKELTLAMANPQNMAAIDAVQFSSNRRVQPVVACRREILDGIDRYYPRGIAATDVSATRALVAFSGGDEGLDLDADETSQSADVAPIVSVCHQILFAAARLGASDVHIEPDAEGVRVRLRIDGVLRDYLVLPNWMKAPLLSRIKVLAHVDIAQ